MYRNTVYKVFTDDLNAAVGVIPTGAEDEVAALEARINARAAEVGWRAA